MPSFDDHLREENKRNGVQWLSLLVFAFQLSIVEQIPRRFELIELFLRLLVHFVHELELFWRCVSDELGHCGQLDKMEEGLMVAKVDPLLHEIHLVQQNRCSLL